MVHIQRAEWKQTDRNKRNGQTYRRNIHKILEKPFSYNASIAYTRKGDANEVAAKMRLFLFFIIFANRSVPF